MNREESQELFENTRTFAIVRGVERERILKLAEAVYEGGIRMMEVTLNSVGAFYMIKDLQKHFGKKLGIGAGTVLDVKDAKAAAEAGASYFTTPNTDKRVIQFGAEENIPVYAGAMTPTEVVRAWREGAAAVKLFPASSLGAGYVKELLGPLGHIPLIAVGGVSECNAADYLRAGCKGIGIDVASICQRELHVEDFDMVRSRLAGLMADVKATLGAIAEADGN